MSDEVKLGEPDTDQVVRTESESDALPAIGRQFGVFFVENFVIADAFDHPVLFDVPCQYVTVLSDAAGFVQLGRSRDKFSQITLRANSAVRLPTQNNKSIVFAITGGTGNVTVVFHDDPHVRIS